VPALDDLDDTIDDLLNFYRYDDKNIGVNFGSLILHSFNSLELTNINFFL
jgi:hypothetical protein